MVTATVMAILIEMVDSPLIRNDHDPATVRSLIKLVLTDLRCIFVVEMLPVLPDLVHQEQGLIFKSTDDFATFASKAISLFCLFVIVFLRKF